MYNSSVILGVPGVARREGGITEKTTSVIAIETNGVDIEGANVSSAKCILHVGLFVGIGGDVVEPVRIQRSGDILQLETKTGSTVTLVQDVNLIPDLGISKMYDRDQGKKSDKRIGEATDGI